MNVKSIFAVGLGLATLGLSLPAFADSATVITNDQSVVVTGNRNNTRQTITNRVSTNERRNRDSHAVDIQNTQSGDIFGNGNRTEQTTRNNVRTVRRGNR